MSITRLWPTIRRTLFALAIWCATAVAHGGFHAEVISVPIGEAAIVAEPALANAQTWQMRASADNEILSMELYVQIQGGSIYQHPAGTNIAPPNPLFLPIFPSLSADSWARVPGASAGPYAPSSRDYGSLYSGGYHFGSTAVHTWMHNLSVDPPPTNFTFAQITMIPSTPEITHSWLARLYERLPGGQVAEHVVTFPETISSPFGADGNLDFKVDGADLELWKANFGQVAPESLGFKAYDLDGDGDTDDIDGGILLSNFGGPGTPSQGDTDGDHDVDGDDFKRLLHYNFGHKWNPADMNSDRVVDGNDFLRWQRQFGGGFVTGVGESAAIPEPSSLMLSLFVSAFGIVGRRCRRFRH